MMPTARRTATPISSRMGTCSMNAPRVTLGANSAALGVGHKAPLFGRTQTHDDPLAGHGLGEQGVARPGPHHAGALQAIGHAHVLRSLPRAVGDEVDERDPRLGVFVSQAELPEATRRPLAPAGIADP